MYGFIYITTNLINGKQQIGKRKIKGNSEDNTYLGSGVILEKAIKKYGRENFKREIIAYAKTKGDLSQLERYYIWLADAVKSDMFYNIQEGGDGGDNTAGWSEEKKQQFSGKMSHVTKGESNGMYGRKHTVSSREKMSKTRKEAYSDRSHYLHSQEFSRKMSEVTKGERNPMSGRKHSEDSKKKMSENRKGKAVGSRNGNYGNHNGKVVYQYEDAEHTILIRTFISLQEAVGSFGLVGTGGLKKAAKENKLYKGYYWSY